MEFTQLLEFCQTQRQREIIQAIIDCDGNQVKAADPLGISVRNVQACVKRVRDFASQQYTPPHDSTVERKIPDGYRIKGVSNMVENSLGKPMWVKTERDTVALYEEMQAAKESFFEDLPKAEPKEIKLPSTDTDLIPWFNIGDAHIGMLAHDAEVGHNFDIKIATRELMAAMRLLINSAPKTNRCVIQDMGDFTHYENYVGKTEASGHDLDYDTRFPKMIAAYEKTMRFIVNEALSKYQYVDVIINQGNHSRVNDHWMAVMLRSIYENEPRLHVLENTSVFIPYRMGNTFVMSHHSDKCKGVKLAGVMANDFAQDWGETKYHYIDVGHVHHKSVTKEDNGAVIESFNQLAAADKYAHDGGWRSRQMLTCVLRSKTYGEKGRIVLTAEEVKDRILKLEPGTTAQTTRKVYTV